MLFFHLLPITKEKKLLRNIADNNVPLPISKAILFHRDSLEVVSDEIFNSFCLALKVVLQNIANHAKEIVNLITLYRFDISVIIHYDDEFEQEARGVICEVESEKMKTAITQLLKEWNLVDNAAAEDYFEIVKSNLLNE